MTWCAICFAGGNKLGKPYLFSISQGSFDEKIWLIIAELALIAITLAIRDNPNCGNQKNEIINS